MNFDQFKCLSFDCYGTLIDWETGLLTSLREILKTHNAKFSEEALLDSFGKTEKEVESGVFRPYRDVLKEVLVRIGNTMGFRASADEQESFAASVRNWPAFPDSTAALQLLATRYQLVILSNIDDDLFRSSEEQLGVDFAKVFTAQQIGSYKPSRQNFQYLIDHIGVDKHEILHVAQSLFHDIVPAKELGLSTVWVNRRHGRGGFGATPSAKADPDLTVPDLRTLAEMALIPS